MKFPVVCFFLLFSSLLLTAQEPYFRYFDLNEEDSAWGEYYPRSAVATPERGFVVGYSTWETGRLPENFPYTTLGIVKTLNNGEIEWSRNIDSEVGLHLRYVTRDGAGNYVVGASEPDENFALESAPVLMWFDPGGNLLRYRGYRQYEHPGWRGGTIGLAEMAGGYLLVTDNTLLARLDAEGNVLDAIHVTGAGPDPYSLRSRSLARDSSGAFCIVGSLRVGSGRTTTGFLLVVDSAGTVISSRILETPYHTTFRKVIGLPEGWLVLGETTEITEEQAQLIEDFDTADTWYGDFGRPTGIGRRARFFRIGPDGSMEEAFSLRNDDIDLENEHLSDVGMEPLAGGDILIWYSTGDDTSLEFFPDGFAVITPDGLPVTNNILDSLPNPPLRVPSPPSFTSDETERRDIAPRGNIDITSFAPASDGGGLFLCHDRRPVPAMFRYFHLLPLPCITQQSRTLRRMPDSGTFRNIAPMGLDATGVDGSFGRLELDAVIRGTPRLHDLCDPPQLPFSSDPAQQPRSGPLQLFLTPNFVRAGQDVIAEFTGDFDESSITLSITDAVSGETTILDGADVEIVYDRVSGRGQATINTTRIPPGIYLITLEAGELEQSAKLSVEE